MNILEQSIINDYSDNMIKPARDLCKAKENLDSFIEEATSDLPDIIKKQQISLQFVKDIAFNDLLNLFIRFVKIIQKYDQSVEKIVKNDVDLLQKICTSQVINEMLDINKQFLNDNEEEDEE